MNEILDKFQAISNTLRNVDDLLKSGELRLRDQGLVGDDGKVVVKSIYSNGITINITSFHVSGSLYPPHCHNESVQTLICSKGKFVVTFLGSAARILNVGDVCVLSPKEMHSVQCIVDDSEVVDICVPKELAYVPNKIGATCE